MFGDRLSRQLRWAIVIAAAVLPYAGPRLAHAAPPLSGTVAINEVESSGGTPGDFIELANTGATPADTGGYVVRDNDDTHTLTLAAGTTIAAGGYYVVEVDTLPGGFGLGAADSARLFGPGGTELLDSYSWTAHAATTYGRCPDGTGTFTTTKSSTKGAANDCASAAPDVKINEVESSDPAVGDYVELINNGASAASIGGYVVKDNDDTHAFTVPSGTSIAAGGYYVADVDTGPTAFGLGSADSARLFTAGAVLVDSFTWTAHAATTYGRCPNGTGPFTTTTAPTRGGLNLCPGDVITSPWPGGASVSTADDLNVFGTNLSGLAYEPSGTSAPGVLWAVRNGPSTLYRLVYDGTKWTPDTTGGWSAGKQLRYPDGTGDPDAEGVTLASGGPAGGVFVSTERNNSAGASRPAILRFVVSSPSTTLVATDDWNLTADLPVLGSNAGAEGIAWISDAVLVAKGLRDERTGAAYDPAGYPGHGSGLFLAGIEQNGVIYAYALDQATGAYSRIATIPSGLAAVMDLEFEPETGLLWAVCDDTCSGRSTTLDVAQTGASAGRFVVTSTYERPAGMPNLNNEGFAIAPRRECAGGLKPAFWTDDNNTGGHALRVGTRNCTAPVAQTITLQQPAAMTFGGGPVALVASSTSGLPVALSASGPCSVTGTASAPTLTASGAGTCVVTARQPGNEDVAAAADVVRTVTIAKAATRLTHTPVSLVDSVRSRRVTVTAVLTSRVTDLPVAGATISFAAARTGALLCTAVTDGAGTATCTRPMLTFVEILLADGTTAAYVGSGDYESSTATSPMKVLGR